MKYIRTKDTIFEVVAEDTKVFTVRAKHNRNHLYNKSKIQTDILKQADTIEEVCDVFVKRSNEPGNPFFDIGYSTIVLDLKFEEYKSLFDHYNYYGAIWTDKGLIYVAKMNDKGELELL